MSEIVTVLLDRKEIDLACYLTAFYNVQVNDDMIKSAIMKD
jgi:hypothetical protein